MSTARSVVQIAIARMIRANAPRFAYIALAMPNLACSRGAPNTAKIATSRPQPVKTRPSLIGLRFIGKGA